MLKALRSQRWAIVVLSVPVLFLLLFIIDLSLDITGDMRFWVLTLVSLLPCGSLAVILSGWTWYRQRGVASGAERMTHASVLLYAIMTVGAGVLGLLLLYVVVGS